MKREEKNIQSRHKIIANALDEFADKGYGLSSINTICSKGKISKGIMYHYFKDKDELYLTCIRECFDKLTEFLRDSLEEGSKNQLQEYFQIRQTFFEKNPLYQRIFCDAIISPPKHLSDEISKIKTDFDNLNISVLTKILKDVNLCKDINIEQVIEIFRLFQDFINARYQMTSYNNFEIKQHDEISSRALNALLYGIIERR